MGCGNLQLRNREKKKNRIASTNLDLPNCQLLFNKGNSYSQNEYWQEAYDTLKHYVEVCPDHANAHSSFTMMHSAVQFLSLNDSTKFIQFREWLKSIVHYPSKNPYYYCMAVYAIAGTYKHTNEVLAVLRYMIDETECNNDGVRRDFDDTRRSQYEQWLLSDTSVVKLDTNLPTLDSLGLSFLRQHGGVVNSTQREHKVLSAQLIPNPSYGEITLAFELTLPATVRLEVFDLLGNLVYTQKSERVFEKGKGELSTDLTQLSAGQYYIRITSSAGEARTLSFIKQ